MIPALIVPVLNRPDLLTGLVESLNHPIGDVVIVDNGNVVDETWTRFMGFRHIRLGHNIGVGAAWNLGLKVTPKAPWWLIANSDVVFGEEDLAGYDEKIDPDSNALFFGLGMAVFAITRHTLATVGYFDENFHPAYDEDLDYQRRAHLVGVERVEVGFTGSHVGSATIGSDANYGLQNSRTHPANDRYYESKWGGRKQGGERFSTPFNRGGHQGDWQLDPERLRAQSWS